MAMNMQKLSLNASRVCEIHSRDMAKKSMNTREIIEWNECVWWEHERVLTAFKDGEEIYGLCALELMNLFI